MHNKVHSGDINRVPIIREIANSVHEKDGGRELLGGRSAASRFLDCSCATLYPSTNSLRMRASRKTAFGIEAIIESVYMVKLMEAGSTQERDVLYIISSSLLKVHFTEEINRL